MSQDQDKLPALGLGTFRLNGAVLTRSIHKALDLGYRHIDTAQMYDNEAVVGAAIAGHDVPREAIFLTSKIWYDQLRHDDLLQSLRDSLKRLDTGYLDLALIHWPSPGGEVPMAETIAALAEARAQGLTRQIGVSNFTVAQLESARAAPGGDQLLANQVEVHPFLANRKVIEATRAAGMQVTAYMPLAVGAVMKDARLQQIADRHDVSPAQVALAWLHQQDIAVIPSSTREAHLRANLASLQLDLDDDEMAAIAALDRGEHIADPDFAPDWDE